MASKTIKQDGVIQNQFITRKKKYILDETEFDRICVELEKRHAA